jgi:hypothetical protein
MPDDTNPYQSPRSFPIPSSQAESPLLASESRDETIAALEARVAQLERQLAQNWLLSPHLLKRAFGVFGYWIIGYALAALFILPILMLLTYLTHSW